MSDLTAAIERLRALHTGAAPGKWEAMRVYSEAGEEAYMHLVRDEKTGLLEWASSKADAEFIAAAYNDLPTLLDEVERLRAEEELTDSEHEEYRTNADRLYDEQADEIQRLRADVKHWTARAVSAEEEALEDERQHAVTRAQWRAEREALHSDETHKRADRAVEEAMKAMRLDPPHDFGEETWRIAGAVLSALAPGGTS